MNIKSDKGGAKGKTLSICIPTWNRKDDLLKNLDIINLRAKEASCNDEIEICISDNASHDGTWEAVLNYSKNSKVNIQYQRNNENLGHDRNILKVANLATGKYIWFLGDDDFIGVGSLKFLFDIMGTSNEINVINLINNESLKKDVHFEIIKSPWTTAISYNFLDGYTISNVICNREMLSQVMKRHGDIIEEGIGCLYIHRFLYSLILLENSNSTHYFLRGKVMEFGQKRHMFGIKNEMKVRLGRNKISTILRKYFPEYSNILKTNSRWEMIFAIEVFERSCYGAVCPKEITNSLIDYIWDNMSINGALLNTLSLLKIKFTPEDLRYVFMEMIFKTTILKNKQGIIQRIRAERKKRGESFISPREY